MWTHITSTYISKACLSSRFREGQIVLRHWQKGIRGAWRGWYGGRRRRVLPDLASQHFTHAPICRGPVVPIWTTFHVSIPTLNYLARPQLSLHNGVKSFVKELACAHPSHKNRLRPTISKLLYGDFTLYNLKTQELDENTLLMLLFTGDRWSPFGPPFT